MPPPAASPTAPPLVIIAARPLPGRVLRALHAAHGQQHTVLVDLRSAHAGQQWPAAWQYLGESQLLDSAALRRDFLEWLEAWPRQPIFAGRTFDEAFRHCGGDSLWWTGPGSSRQPTKGPLFASFRAVWVCRRALDQLRPQHLVIYAPQRRLAALLLGQAARLGIEARLAPGSARPAASPWRGRPLWLLGSLLMLLVQPAWILLRAAFARCTAGVPVAADRSAATILMTGWFPQHVRRAGTAAQVWYWRQLAAALGRGYAPVRVRYLLYTSRFRLHGWLRPLGAFFLPWWRLRRVPDLVPIPQVYTALGAYFRALPDQLRALGRWWRAERDSRLRQSFLFAGADLAPLLVAPLRRQVASLARWERNVQAVVRSLRAAGKVRAVLVHEEFYPKGMLTIAAARRLGIPTVGVQHGTISPEHLVYCVPAGHVARAPTPDYFAAYGPFALEVVSRHGHFPAERVWITGGPRFDHLAGRWQDPLAARAELHLPADKYLVLAATQQFAWSRRPLEALFQALAGRDDILVCVKTHPHERKPEQYRALAAACGADNVRYFTDRFDDLLAACDLLVSRSSTTLLEAILAGKPTICINFSDEPDRYPYVADGGSLAADTAESVWRAVASLRRGDGRAQLERSRPLFLARHLGPTLHGQAAATFAGLLAEAFLDPAARARSA